MLKVHILGSGSKGNCSVIETPQMRIMVDVGLSSKRICQGLARVGLTARDIDAILLTHEHSDHICGLKVFSKQCHAPLYVSNLLKTELCYRLGDLNYVVFESGSSFYLGSILVQSFKVQHDCIDPVGYSFKIDDRQLAFVTDSGCVTNNIRQVVGASNFLYLESNYDNDMLLNHAERPMHLKQRIANNHGHLSNAQASALLAECHRPHLQQLVLAHLSDDCNTSELAVASMQAALQQSANTHVQLHCVSQKESLSLNIV